MGLSKYQSGFSKDFLNSFGRLSLFGGQKKFINLIPLSPRKKEIELKSQLGICFSDRNSKEIEILKEFWSHLFYTFILLRNSSRLMIRILLGKAVDFAKQMVNVTVDRRALMRKSLLRITRVSSCSADLLPTTIMDNQFSLFSSYYLSFIIELLIILTWFHKFPIPNSEFRLSHVYFNQ